jgi:hypothetical protein
VAGSAAVVAVQLAKLSGDVDFSTALSGIRIDALVGSGKDRLEQLDPDTLDPPPALVVTTAGKQGGTTNMAPATLAGAVIHAIDSQALDHARYG